MRKIEKPTIKHKIIGEKHIMGSPYGDLDIAFPECKGKLIYVWEYEVADEDNFKPPTQFYVATADGGRMYFKTNSRARAQELADAAYGVGKYTVKIVVRASVR